MNFESRRLIFRSSLLATFKLKKTLVFEIKKSRNKLSIIRCVNFKKFRLSSREIKLKIKEINFIYARTNKKTESYKNQTNSYC